MAVKRLLKSPKGAKSDWIEQCDGSMPAEHPSSVYVTALPSIGDQVDFESKAEEA